MCCSGNHNQNRPKTFNTNTPDEDKNKGKIHFPLMLCCLIPIALMLLLNALGIGKNLNGLFPILMIVACVGSHFLMHGHTHQKDQACCKDKETPENRQ